VEREVVIPRPDGTTDVMLMTKFPVLGPDNEVAGVGGISTKITERKLAEAALRDSEERLSGILDTAVDGIVTIDEGGGILSFNRAAETLFGYTADEVQGRNVSLLMPEPHRGRHDGFLARYLGGGEAKNVGFTREFEGRRKDGHVFPLQVSVSELRQGGKRLFTGILRDITKRKAEEEKLRVATDLAESANRAKSEFLTGMSHELRTPLNAILGFAQLLQYRTKEPLTPSQGDSVQQILKGGTHLLDLINEILNLAQIEAGKVGLSIEDVDPGEIVGECLALIRPQAEERGIKFVEDLDPRAMPVVRVDSTRFKQVLLNLLSNAVKYNRHDGTVTLACRESSGGMLRVSVADTGSGIPEDKQGAVFEPFNRLGAEATEVEGSGLGLTVSKKLVELMGGRIAFESTWGKGSTFWFEVPLAKEGVSGEPEDGTDGAVTGKAAAVLPPGDHTLLYVEDNLPNLRLMKALIGNLPNVTLLLAQDAETGVAMAKDRQPDVIVMDINLPGMDGFEALKRLRRSKKTRAIPVIALTASALARNREKGLEAGFRHYLTKPLDLERFLEALAETLARARDAD
jgi:PAS domain S-box-containing protein